MTPKYKRLYQNEEDHLPWIRLKFKYYALTVCSLPCLGFIFCVSYSLIYNFKSSTSTSCGAYNILPSISAAIGDYSPQKEVWRASITLTFVPRILIIKDYVQFCLDVCQEKSFSLIYCLGILNFIENCALLSLSYYDSTFYYSMHKKSFITFVISSQVYMILLIVLKVRCSYKLSGSERFGLKLKKVLAAVNVGGMLLAMYYFIDHNFNCQDYVYTKFAFCEYVVVFTNIAYHTTIIYDFPYRCVVISPRYCIKLEEIGRYRRPLISQA